MESRYSLSMPVATWPESVYHLGITRLEKARELVGTADLKARQRKSEVYYQGIESRQRLPQGMHDRCEEFVYAAGSWPSEKDITGLEKHLPLHFKIIRLRSHRVAKGEVWDLSVKSKKYWPELDHLEELYVFLLIDHLILEENAKVIIQGNVLSIECGVLERATNKPDGTPVSADNFDIGILPTPFTVDRNTSQNTGTPGKVGLSGAHGADGKIVQVEGSLLGPYLPEEFSQIVTDGQDGGHGADGTHGVCGRNGGMCRLADIRINRLIGFEHNPLKVFSQAGDGYTGGAGGDGGNGGNGGNGSAGAEAINGRIPHGKSSKGGNGGNGGNGSKGGNGGMSSNVFLQLFPEDCISIQTLSLPSKGGGGGQEGKGGLAGIGGHSFVHEQQQIYDNSDNIYNGLEGNGGVKGFPGKGRLGANIFVIPMDRVSVKVMSSWCVVDKQ